MMRIISLLLLSCLLAGCSGRFPPIPHPGGEAPANAKVKIGKPYKVAGQWYTPVADLYYNETGIASWYGSKFHGRRTANGEIFNMNTISAAHKTLPLPSWVRVTNLDNGRKLVVRVNDRGPFIAGRIIDLSKEAAKMLGFLRHGTARVRVENISSLVPNGRRVRKLVGGQVEQEVKSAEPRTGKPVVRVGIRDESKANVDQLKDKALITTAVKAKKIILGRALNARSPNSKTKTVRAKVHPKGKLATIVDDLIAQPVKTELFIQLGAFHYRSNALRLQQSLFKKNSPLAKTAFIYITKSLDHTLYRVRIGPLMDLAGADAALAQLIEEGHVDGRITPQSL